MTALSSIIIGFSIQVASCPVKYNMEPSPSWEGNGSSASQKFPAFYGARGLGATFTSTQHLSILLYKYALVYNIQKCGMYVIQLRAKTKLLRNSQCYSTPIKIICSRPGTGTVQVKNPHVDSKTATLLVCKMSVHITQQNYIRIQLLSYINLALAGQIPNEQSCSTVKGLGQGWQPYQFFPTAYLIPSIST